jgi:two-component system sensor histidine kinase KdpD
VRGIVGALGISGGPSLRRLVLRSTLAPSGSLLRPQVVASTQDEQVTLFAAFCDQIALALDQFALRREIIHTEALRESDRLKTALLGSVTHDLRTPLAAIQAAAGSLLDEDIEWSDAERRAFAETIESSSERLTRLVSNLLDVSRLEAGVLVPERRWHPLGDVLAAVLDRLELAGRTGGRDIIVDLPDDLPLAYIDHAQIEQVFTNLIENAIKYSPPGSPISVRARMLDEPPAIEVRVIDHGVGIPPGELRAIFDKFYRVQHVDLPWNNGRPPTGTGLGLAICAGIVQAHGGSIWAESAPGEGTTMIFTLPMPANAEVPTPKDAGRLQRPVREAQAVPPAAAAERG